MNNYHVGNVVRLAAIFTNSAGVQVDPSSVASLHRIIKPVLTAVQTTTYGVGSVTRVSTGSYYYDLAVNSPGELHYRYEGRGDNPAATEGQMQVLVPVVGPWVLYIHGWSRLCGK